MLLIKGYGPICSNHWPLQLDTTKAYIQYLAKNCTSTRRTTIPSTKESTTSNKTTDAPKSSWTNWAKTHKVKAVTMKGRGKQIDQKGSTQRWLHIDQRNRRNRRQRIIRWRKHTRNQSTKKRKLGRKLRKCARRKRSTNENDEWTVWASRNHDRKWESNQSKTRCSHYSQTWPMLWKARKALSSTLSQEKDLI